MPSQTRDGRWTFASKSSRRVLQVLAPMPENEARHCLACLSSFILGISRGLEGLTTAGVRFSAPGFAFSGPVPCLLFGPFSLTVPKIREDLNGTSVLLPLHVSPAESGVTSQHLLHSIGRQCSQILPSPR